MRGLYIHVPFCKRKCRYCDFLSFCGNHEAEITYYMRCLKKEIRQIADSGPLDTVFIGGGTPSILPYGQVAELMDTVKTAFALERNSEVTIESNPGTLDARKADEYRSAGINRISIGAQSFDDESLSRIGRIHNANDIWEACNTARAAGFENINLDLMYGLPGQTLSAHLESVNAALELEPEHISMYALILEEGTRLYEDVNRGKERLPYPDTVADMGDAAAARLKANGYHRYEVSNFAKESRECRHNLLYWQGGDYFAAGLGAAGAMWQGDAVTRTRNTAKMQEYLKRIERQESAVTETEHESGRDAMFTYIMMALRTVDGFSRGDFAKKFGMDFEQAFPKSARRNGRDRLLLLEPDTVRLSQRGMDVMNIVLSDILSEV